MSHIRVDPFTGREVIAGARAPGTGPLDFLKPLDPDVRCRYCPDGEYESGREVFSAGASETGTGRKIRVIQLSGTLSPEEKLEPGEKESGELPGAGVHEVVIESPYHKRRISEVSEEDLGETLSVYQERISSIYAENEYVRYVAIFKNQGSGRQSEHLNTQILGLPFIPRDITEELNRSGDYFINTRRCLGCDVVSNAASGCECLVEASGSFTGLVPYAPRYPLETHIYPKQHHSTFHEYPGDKLVELASMLKSLTGRIESIAGEAPVSYVLHTSPRVPAEEFYHWHIEIYPLITCVGGFELGNGAYINPMSPEESAEMLREARVAL